MRGMAYCPNRVHEYNLHRKSTGISWQKLNFLKKGQQIGIASILLGTQCFKNENYYTTIC